MPATPRRAATFRVEFDPTALAQDANHSAPKARAVMREAIRELDHNGIPASRLKACEDPGRDGTRLPGCATQLVSTSLPRR